MKKTLCTLALLFVSLIGYSQKGISYQAIILDPQKIEIPGQEITEQPLLNGDVWMKFSIYSNSVLQFEEVQKTKTDNYGLINLLIGSVSSASFNSLVWDTTQKSLEVNVSFNQGASYTKISEQKLTYSPYSLYSETAGKLGGILGISGGGTGATTLADALVNLGVDKVDNTPDAAKPISSATLAALNLKASTNDLNSALALKVNKSEISDVTTSLNLKASASDVTSALALKANTSDVISGLALKINASQLGVANGIATLNASGIIPSSQLPPVTLSSTSVVGSNAEMMALSSATVGSIAIRTDANKNYVLSALPASTLANWIELLTPAAPVQAVNGYTGSVNIAKTDVGLGSVDNTSDASKPVSNPTQAALNLKLDANKVGVASGVASLNALGKIPTDQIPSISFSSVKVLNSQADMLALSNSVVGSVVIRTDVNKNYVLSAADPAVLANWIELLTPAPPVQTVNGMTGSISLTKSDVGLGNAENTSDANKPVSSATQTALNLKANATDVTTSLAAKANATDMTTALAAKANAADVTTSLAAKANAASLATVATSGDFNDLTNIPTTTAASTLSGTVAVTNGGTGLTSVGLNGQVLSSTGSGTLTWTTPSAASAGVPYTGATGAVNLGGYNLTVNELTIGSGKVGTSGSSSNTIVGGSGVNRTFTSVLSNTAIGYNTLSSSTPGNNNTVLGAWSLVSNTGEENSAMGVGALERNLAGGKNTAIGYYALRGNTTGSNNTAIGYAADLADGLSNSTAIGNGATVAASNTIQLGNTDVLNVKTSGTLTAGDVTYPKLHGTSGQVLSTTGTGTLTWTTPSSGITTMAAIGSTPNANGASISGTTLNLQPANATNGGIVTTGDQTFAGSKTFNNNIKVNSLKIGAPASGSQNTMFGASAFQYGTPGNNNTAIGANSLASTTNSTNGGSPGGNDNTAVGSDAIRQGQTTANGNRNTGVGSRALTNASDASNNTGLGYATLTDATGGQNTAVGSGALAAITSGTSNTAVGYGATVSSGAQTNSTAIGNGATVAASNTIQLGNTDVLNVKTSGSLTAGTVTYPNAHGTSGQVLSTTGSGTLTWTSSSASSGVPYTGATGGVNLGGYDLTVNELAIGSGKVGASGSSSNTILGGAGVSRAFTTVLSNTAIGYNTMSAATPGNNNTSVGAYSLVSTTGRENSVLGAAAMERNLGGNENTAIGYYAMQNNLSGSGNTALGYKAGFSSDNTTINNATAIGYQAKVAASNTIQLGADGTNGTTAITNVKTSGSLTAGTVTYPNAHGTSGQVLSTTGSGTLTWTSSSASSGVPYTGATGGVNLGGYDLTVNELAIGSGKVGASGSSSNTILGGAGVSRAFTTVLSNTAIGYNTMSAATPGNNNTSVGAYSLVSTTGRENSVLGAAAMERNLGGNENTAIGYYAMQNNLSGSGNTALGYKAGFSSDNTTINNATAIGYQAKVAASNTIQLGADGTNGTTAITNVKTSGSLTAGTVTYPNAHGTSGQVLSTTGSGTLTWTSSSASSGVPYTGATGAVNLGGYDLTVNELAIGSGKVGASGSSSNTILGGAGVSRAFTSVLSNTAIGYNTMSNATPGNNNTSVGAYSLVSTTGRENSVLGAAAMERNLGGNENTAIGYYAMQNNLSGSGNTALGYKAGFSSDNTTINNATAIGYQAKVAASNTMQLGADGTNGTTAITNVKTSGSLTAGTVTYPNAHGTSGQVLSTTGSGTLTWTSSSASSGVPYTGATGGVNLGGYDLTVNGMTIGSGKVGSTATLSTIVGEYALNRTNRGTDNTAIGYKSMGNEGSQATSAGSKNTAIGSWTLITNSGQENSAMGNGALEGNQNGNQNTAMGSRALNVNLSGSNNTALGYAADVLTNNLSNATAIGNGAKVAASNTIQLGNTDVTNVITSGNLTVNGIQFGRGAGNVSTNTAAGSNALLSNTTGDFSAAVGTGALQSNTTGRFNSAVGTNALLNNTTGSRNIAMGSAALQNNTTGQSNTAMGFSSNTSNTTGTSNTAFGNSALSTNTTGSYNTALGAEANVTANNLTNATAIGYQASATVSNTIQLGNTAVTNVNTSGTITAAGLAVSGDVTSSGGSISGFDAALNNQTGTTYTLTSSDNGKVITLNNASAITLTINTGLGDGFNCLIVQKGAGQITISGTATRINRQSHTKTAGQYAVVSIVNIGGDNVIVAGDTSN